MPKRGFTIVEMMIVVAIIGILIALAIPNFIHSREHVYRDMCINNLRQIRLAKAQWALENNKVDGYSDFTAEDLDPYVEGNISSSLVCPLDSGGSVDSSYTINPIGTDPTCKKKPSEHHL